MENIKYIEDKLIQMKKQIDQFKNKNLIRYT